MSTFSRILRFFSKRAPAARGFIPLEAKNLRFFLIRKRIRPLTGFTLIELLVVSMIIVLITAFVLFRQQGFNSSTLLRSLSYSIALSVRQAQVYGVSVRESAAGTGMFASGYGVYFGNTGLADSSHYLLFADRGDGRLADTSHEGAPDINGNGTCDVAEDCLAQRYTIGNGRGTDYLIKNICAHVISPPGDQCGSGTATTITSLTVYFRRPNPDACFATTQSPTACATATTPPVYDYAYVQLKSFAGADWRTIKISSTGQITVCKPNLDSAGVAAC